jgi:RES domain-containing protein
MIVRPVAGTFYRFNTPKWAYQPTSGAGAARHGGRLNRPGIDALYFSKEVETAASASSKARLPSRPVRW